MKIRPLRFSGNTAYTCYGEYCVEKTDLKFSAVLHTYKTKIQDTLGTQYSGREEAIGGLQ